MERMFVGIDVAKDRLDVHLRPSGEAFAAARDGKGLEALVDRLGGLDVALVVLEATGGFEVTAGAALCAAGLPLAVVNPRQIWDFARATGRLARTDAPDAAAIAHFAEAVRPDPRPAPDEQARALGELVTRRRQIIEMIWAERNRRQRLASRRMVGSIDPVLAAPQRELSDLETERGDTNRQKPPHGATPRTPPQKRPRGRRCHRTHPDRRPPRPRNPQPKTQRRTRRRRALQPRQRNPARKANRPGRPCKRPRLYRAALSASRYNPAPRRFYKRLTDAGKPKTRSHRRHEKAPHNPQRHPQRQKTWRNA